VPEGFFVSKDELVDKISPYCREGEAPRDWASILQFLFVDPAYHGRILSALDFMEDSDDDPALVSLLAASKMWLEGGYCDLAIQRLPGNIRATLASFESNENTSATTHLFKPRKGYGSLQQELKPLLRYLMRAHTTIIDDLKALLPDDPETILRKNIIPAILSRVAVEEVPDQNSITHVAWFSLFQSFHRQGKGGAIKLVECGWYGSKLACILHLLRCGVACFMAYSPSNNLMSMAKSMQGAQTVNMISPWIRQCRSMSERKPPKKTSLVNVNNDITCSGWTFRREMYALLIPRFIDHCSSLLQDVFHGDSYTAFLRADRNRMSLRNWRDLDITIITPSGEFESKSLPLAEGYEVPLLKLASSMAFALWTLGVGATRYEEIVRMRVEMTQFSGSHCYYHTNSEKSGCLGARSAGLSEHRLSCKTTLVFMLYRVALKKAGLSAGSGDDSLFPFDGMNDSQEVREVCQRLFDFDSVPHALAVRHFVTSVHNILFSGDQGTVVANPAVAEMSGHSASTHESAYATSKVGWQELVYDQTHSFLGDGSVLSVDQPVFADKHLLRALRIAINSKATWKPGQLQMVRDSMAKDHHVFIGAPCGGGKTLCVSIQLLVPAILGVRQPCKILIVPYKFLGAYVEVKIKVRPSSLLLLSFVFCCCCNKELGPGAW